jgi:hypothetical protein
VHETKYRIEGIKITPGSDVESFYHKKGIKPQSDYYTVLRHEGIDPFLEDAVDKPIGRNYLMRIINQDTISLFGLDCLDLRVVQSELIFTRKIGDDQPDKQEFSEETLFGKWELVLHNDFSPAYGVYERQPRGYVEYLPDGRFAWYHYQREVYTLFEEEYRMEKYGDYENNNEWEFYYEPKIPASTFFRVGYNDHFMSSNDISRFRFLHQNTVVFQEIFTFDHYIYKRKN